MMSTLTHNSRLKEEGFSHLRSGKHLNTGVTQFKRMQIAWHSYYFGISGVRTGAINISNYKLGQSNPKKLSLGF
jgi:hypothetical protein